MQRQALSQVSNRLSRENRRLVLQIFSSKSKTSKWIQEELSKKPGTKIGCSKLSQATVKDILEKTMAELFQLSGFRKVMLLLETQVPYL